MLSFKKYGHGKCKVLENMVMRNVDNYSSLEYNNIYNISKRGNAMERLLMKDLLKWKAKKNRKWQ